MVGIARGLWKLQNYGDTGWKGPLGSASPAARSKQVNHGFAPQGYFHPLRITSPFFGAISSLPFLTVSSITVFLGQLQLRHMFPLIRVSLLTCSTILEQEFCFLPESWSSALSCVFSCGAETENQSLGILKYRGAGGWLPVNEALIPLHVIGFPFCHLQLTTFDLKFEFGPKCQWNISKVGFS